MQASKHITIIVQYNFIIPRQNLFGNSISKSTWQNVKRHIYSKFVMIFHFTLYSYAKSHQKNSPKFGEMRFKSISHMHMCMYTLTNAQIHSHTCTVVVMYIELFFLEMSMASKLGMLALCGLKKQN